ncbi:MAG TPA: metalloregulator ArsR/SmtB family transcription factor [bacterium]|nr:metalloregulator ArsR/SmtB family transcription factor [bacterium]
MSPKTKARYEARAGIIKALSHPTRLFIVDQLQGGKKCVCELTKMIGADMSTVSKHLSVLKAVGIVHDEKVGQQVFYRLKCPCVLKFFECVESVMRSNAEEQLALLR